ncbi:S-methyl-5'-thioadenosine phosphorylase [Dethiobacter alkaliphilus]|uniref:S-methyl-5'-thioadenosine phosphorylase n=1 Tax=Dethiobacter alkaliphilus TaxID=427926 RepID=UPI002227A59F|nr:S-methyl-5'-thioadenosine phosphorylase [Dethiobacter alkaliphilus]MCW3489566.1 S-methyl-5'-thioadenosine phosphorylase [Dethiobacter alkaliphilus]
MSVELAIIGGTGVYDPKLLEDVQTLEIDTRYGRALLTQGKYQGREVVFLARHGTKHGTPPHNVNYRANIAALVKLGVKRVVATAAVGSLNEKMPPGAMILLGQFLDFTKAREATFFDGGEAGVVHTDFTAPYCPQLNGNLLTAAKQAGLELLQDGVYVCTEGPRFESAAEIRMYQKLGGDLVGMTNVPEVVLAREAGLCYSTVALSTNFGAGISPTVLTHEEVLEVMAENVEKVRRLLMELIPNLADHRDCDCEKLGSEILL